MCYSISVLLLSNSFNRSSSLSFLLFVLNSKLNLLHPPDGSSQYQKTDIFQNPTVRLTKSGSVLPLYKISVLLKTGGAGYL